MARFLALDWAQNRLHLVTATVSRGQVRLEQAVVLEETQTLTPASAEILGQRLRKRLKAARIAPAPLLVCIGREQVIVKEVRYPRTDPNQVPALVRFQATKELTESAESVVIDYTPLDRPGPQGEQRALVVIARRDLVSAYQAVARAANLKLLAIAPRPLGIGACLRRVAAPPAEGASAILAVSDNWAEFCVFHGDTPLFARPLGSAPANLIAEVRRNLSLYAGQPHVGPPGQDAVAALFLAGDSAHAVLREQLGQLLAIPVQPLDPFALQEQVRVSGDRGGYTGAVGLVYQWAERQAAPINFADPKEPKPPTDTGRRKALRAAGVAVLALIGLVFLSNLILASQRNEIARLKEEKEGADQQLKKLEPDKRAIASLKEWHETALSDLDEIYDLAALFPFEPGLRVTLVRIEPLGGTRLPGQGLAGGKAARESKETYTVRVRLQGLVPKDDTALVEHFVQQINREKYRRAIADYKNAGGGAAVAGSSAKALQEFTVDIDLAPRSPAEYTALLVPPQREAEPEAENPLDLWGEEE